MRDIPQPNPWTLEECQRVIEERTVQVREYLKEFSADSSRGDLELEIKMDSPLSHLLLDVAASNAGLSPIREIPQNVRVYLGGLNGKEYQYLKGFAAYYTNMLYSIRQGDILSTSSNLWQARFNYALNEGVALAD